MMERYVDDHVEPLPDTGFYPREVVGRWPGALWGVGLRKELGGAALERFDGRTWRRVTMLHADDVFGGPSGFMLSPWKGGAVIVGWTSLDPQTQRLQGEIRAYGTTTPAPACTDESGRKLVGSVNTIAGFDTGHVVVAGLVGPGMPQDDSAAAFVWAPGQRFPKVLHVPDCNDGYCHYRAFIPSPSDFVMYGWQSRGNGPNVASAWRLRNETWERIEMPDGEHVRSYARQRDGTEWAVIDGDEQRLVPEDFDTHLWRRAPGKSWDRIALPTPALSRRTIDMVPTAHKVHVIEDDSVWVEASYFEECDRGMIVSTRQPASICLLGDERGCMSPQKEGRAQG